MRFSAIAIITCLGAVASTTANLVARQNSYPTCSLPCVANPDIGDCVSVTDTHCLCTNPTFVDSTTACIQKACSGQDLDNALAFSRSLCAKVGVTLTSSINTASQTGTSSSSTGTPTSPSSSSGSSSATSASASPSTGAASSHGVNSLFGLVAAGLAILAL